jgi:hypothetical protein
MKPLHKGITLAVVHVLLVCSLGAKLLIDRSRCPRVWVKAAAYDPNLPIRGRYASMRLIVEAPQAKPMEKYNGIESPSFPQRARLVVRGGKLAAIDDPWGSVSYQRIRPDQVALHEPVAFFISEKAKDPTIRAREEELWVEVTVPRKGAPRPIRLAVKKNGALQPLNLD